MMIPNISLWGLEERVLVVRVLSLHIGTGFVLISELDEFDIHIVHLCNDSAAIKYMMSL